MDDRAATRKTPPAEEGANSHEQQQQQLDRSASFHASRSLQSLISDQYQDDDERTRGSSRQFIQTNRSSNNLGGSFHHGSSGSNGARRRGQRRGRSAPQPRAERSASRLLCPSSAEESHSSSDGDSPDSNSDSDCDPSRQVEAAAPKVHPSRGAAVPASGETSSDQRRPVVPPPARRGRRRQRQLPRPPPPPDRAEAVSSPTHSASADSTAGLYFYRTRSNSADTRHSAEQLLSIAQALQRSEEKKSGGNAVGGAESSSSVAGGGGGAARIPPRGSSASLGEHQLEKAGGGSSSTAAGSGSGSGSGPRGGINNNHPAAASPARSRASRAMSATTGSQITDGGWSTGTGSSHSGNNSDHSSDDGSESFVSWNESEHGSLPSHHRRAKDAIVGGRVGGGGGEDKGGRRSSATNRMLIQLGVGAVPFDGSPAGAEDRQSKPPPTTRSSAKPAPAPKVPTLSSSERAQRLMDKAQRNVAIRRSKQIGLFGGYERKVPAAAASSSAAEQHRGEGTSRGSSSGPSAVARVLMDSLQDDGHGDHDDSSTADGCYEDVESALGDGYGDDDADDRSAEASVRRLGGRVGIARPAYPFSFGEDDSRDRSEELDSEVSQKVAGDELEGPKAQQSRYGADNGNTGNASRKHPNSPSSKSSWISGSVSLDDDDDDGTNAKVDEHLKEKLGLGRSTPANSTDTGSDARKEE